MTQEGNLQAPERQPLEWKTADFYDAGKLYAELERVFDICHGCRRCVSLCQSFPTLFDLVDESETLEVDGVDKGDYMKVVDECYLCDLCAETKCPYVPPHPWAVDFPHLMLRAKAYKFRNGQASRRGRLIASTDPIFDALSTPGVAQAANAAARNKPLRKLGRALLDIHPDAPLPRFESKPLSKRLDADIGTALEPVSGGGTTGRVALYLTCYGDHSEQRAVEDLIAVLNHNGVPVRIIRDAHCCGMPKFELGDLDKVAALKDANLPQFLAAIDEGCDILAPVPSCILMYKQEIPLMFPDDADVARVKEAFFDPFEYLMLRHKAGLVRTEFARGLGKVAYHAACHQRVQNIGMRTREFLSLIPDTDVAYIDRCSGHDGTYGVRTDTYPHALKISRPVVRRVQEANADTYGSDCPLAGRFIEHGMEGSGEMEHPISMVRRAYGV